VSKHVGINNTNNSCVDGVCYFYLVICTGFTRLHWLRERLYYVIRALPPVLFVMCVTCVLKFP